jgi:hypothetical protein
MREPPGRPIGRWLKRRTPLQKWLLVILCMALVALYLAFEARELWRWRTVFGY